MANFELITDLEPKGDQPKAIDELTKRILDNERYSTLLGVTGSGKTRTLAGVIEDVNKPILVISHNKTLAAQLYAEFKSFFPKNAVHYFVSYYDYYQPEAYIPQRDIYIEKDAQINQDLDRLRLAATNALLSRRDVIIVASVSCIYNIGSPEDYLSISRKVKKGTQIRREDLIRRLADMQYERNETEFRRGRFRVRGDVIDLYPSYDEAVIRFEFADNNMSRILQLHPVTNDELYEFEEVRIYPAKYFITPQERIERAFVTIEEELIERLKVLRDAGKLVEAQRLEARTRYDMEMLREVGYCKGIENYSRHLTGRAPGERPSCLIDYFPKDFMCIVDESHVALPQLRGMYNGDRSRKEVLVEHGFRLSSCLDNRPLRFEEWINLANQLVFVSATPSPYEIKLSKGHVVEQIIRPTGLVDPKILVKPTKGQINHLISMINGRVKQNERVLVTTLTKRLAEDLSSYLQEEGIKCRYLHSEIETLDRVKILRELREGRFDVLVGVNLLREGLDLPEVSLVAILDADKEGFLRSETSIIQTVGRTARNINAEVILYADKVTPSMQNALNETDRRRNIQLEFNKKHGITPQTIQKEIKKGVEELLDAERLSYQAAGLSEGEYRLTEVVKELEREMVEAANALDFERAAHLRDMIRNLTKEYKPEKKKIFFSFATH